MIFEIISGGEKTDWVGKEWAGLFFPRGKNGPAHSFPGEKTDWGEIPACYTGFTSLSDETILSHGPSPYDLSCWWDVKHKHSKKNNNPI